MTTASDGWAPVRYTLAMADEAPCPVTFAEFHEANRDGVSAEEFDEIRLLAPGETHAAGGGAQPMWSLTRLEAARRETYCNDGATLEPWTLADFDEANAEDPDFASLHATVAALAVGESACVGMVVVTRLT
jgi:hypothetical protein